MKFKKTLILFVIISVLTSLFAVTCFADASNGIFIEGDVYTFNEDLNPLYNAGVIDAEFHCFVGGFRYDFYFARLYNGVDGYALLEFVNEGGTTVVFENGRWLDEGYRTIIFDAYYDASYDNPNGVAFIYTNGYDGETRQPIYQELRDTIINYVFGGRPLYYEEELAVNSVCIVASLFVAFLPLLVILWLSRWIVTLGRGAL